MGERRFCKPEVAGSTPVVSKKKFLPTLPPVAIRTRITATEEHEPQREAEIGKKCERILKPLARSHI